MGDVVPLTRAAGSTAGPARLQQTQLRRQISLAIWRALADPRFARALLANPGAALGGQGCAPHERRKLLTIRAPTIREFAAQSEALFWEAEGPVRSAWVHLARTGRLHAGDGR